MNKSRDFMYETSGSDVRTEFACVLSVSNCKAILVLKSSPLRALTVVMARLTRAGTASTSSQKENHEITTINVLNARIEFFLATC